MINRYIERSYVQRERKSENRDRKWYEKDRWREEIKKDKLINTHLLRDWQKGR